MITTRDEKVRWRAEIASARESIRHLKRIVGDLKSAPMGRRNPMRILELDMKIGEYRSIIQSRQRAIKVTAA